MQALSTQMNALSLGQGAKAGAGRAHIRSFVGLRGASLGQRSVVKNVTLAPVRRQPLQVQNVRIAGAEVPNNKRVVISLTYVYGVGLTTSKAVLRDTNVSEDKRVKDLTDEELAAIRAEVNKYMIEGDLRRFTALNIKRLKDIQCYRGRRHIMNLPCRGQKTKTNARTRRGKRMAVAGKKKAPGPR
eukprot:scaffold2991_cov403-Prasinococcus_capsulatus_cf.AAC.9